MECSVLYFLHFLCKLFPFQSLLLLSWLLVLAFLQLFEPSHQHYTTTLPFAASAVFSPIFIFPLSILPVFFFSSFSFTTDQQTSPSCLTFFVQYIPGKIEHLAGMLIDCRRLASQWLTSYIRLSIMFHNNYDDHVCG